MNISKLDAMPLEFIYGALKYIHGMQLPRIREVSKLFKASIDAKENELYQECARHESPAHLYKRWTVVERIDWLELYKSVPVAKKAIQSSKNLHRALIFHNQVDQASTVLDWIEFPFLVLNVVLCSFKLYTLGTKAIRDLVKHMIKENPAMTLLEAYQKLFPGKYPIRF